MSHTAVTAAMRHFWRIYVHKYLNSTEIYNITKNKTKNRVNGVSMLWDTLYMSHNTVESKTTPITIISYCIPNIAGDIDTTKLAVFRDSHRHLSTSASR